MLLVLALAALPAIAQRLEDDLGRTESRVWSEAYPVPAGRTIDQAALVERLERLGYARVHEQPEWPGQYFWGHEVFWIYRRGFRHGGRWYEPELLGLQLERATGRILGGLDPAGLARPLRDERERLEPELLAESLDEPRAPRLPIRIGELPEHAWRAVLAAEDARFFEHPGVDSRAVARALLANVRAGEIAQGGSTITQQLIKNRDLTPRRSLGRKVSEAVRALALEAEYDKREILEAYLNHVYMGHDEGFALHGLGTAARSYFSVHPRSLDLAQAATLAAMIQGPNRLNPERHPERARERRDRVLGRMEELGWASPTEVAAARRRPVRVDRTPPPPPPAQEFRDWVAALAAEGAGGRLDQGRGVVAETTLDPYLQARAEETVANHLDRLRRSYPLLRRVGLSAALVALDARTGAVLAYVGGDPEDRRDQLDRARLARRQVGSTIKPLVLLEAFEDCGSRAPLHPATRVADEPLELDLSGSRTWRPENYDGRFHGIVDVREALRESYNVPFVRIARHCGFAEVAARIERAGLSVPDDLPPAFVLGAIEASPLELVEAYTLFAAEGRRLRPYGVRRLAKPSGRQLERWRRDRDKVVRPATAYIVRDLMLDAVEAGTGQPADLQRLNAAGKTGTSSGARDAWFVGQAGSVVTVAWIGLDRDGRLGLTGAQAAAPLWRRFMAEAAPARTAHAVDRPWGVVTKEVDPATGLRLSGLSRRGGHDELFRRGHVPPKDRLLRRDDPARVIR